MKKEGGAVPQELKLKRDFSLPGGQKKRALPPVEMTGWIVDGAFYREKGYITQAIPMPTNRNSTKDHKIYLTRSFGWRRPRNPKATEMTAAKINNA